MLAVEKFYKMSTMGIVVRNKINQLLSSSMDGGLYFSNYLRGKGYSAQLLEKYRKSGWLVPLANGVMYRPAESLSAVKAVSSFYNQICRTCRIAAHSALAVYGYNHFVPMGKPVLMLTGLGAHTPKWMSSPLLDMTIKTFYTSAFEKTIETERSIDGAKVLVSVPEQAFLECLLLAGKEYSYIDLYYIMEQLTTLRHDVVQTLLENTKNLSVKRMFLYMSEKAGHYWFSKLDLDRINLGTSKLQLVKDGVYVSKYKITVPKELNDYE